MAFFWQTVIPHDLGVLRAGSKEFLEMIETGKGV